MYGIMNRFMLLFAFSAGICINANSQLPSSMKEQLYQHHARAGVGKPYSMVLSPKCNLLDTCILKVTYSLCFVNDTIKRDKMKDIQLLKIGHKVSSCFSYLLYQKDSTVTALDKKGITTVRIQDEYLFPEEVVTYFTKNQIQVRYRTEYDFTNLCYVEALPNIQWTLSDGHKNILGYNCQKALCEFRGRKYIAWYSTEIPINAGPYKFHGLPGLILAISDMANDYCWECIGIQKGNNNDFVSQYKGKYMKDKTVTREEIRNIIARLHKDPAGNLYLSKQSIHIIDGGKCYQALSGDFPPEPYNPIEKE